MHRGNLGHLRDGIAGGGTTLGVHQQQRCHWQLLSRAYVRHCESTVTKKTAYTGEHIGDNAADATHTGEKVDKKTR
jgi:hypothetical protein